MDRFFVAVQRLIPKRWLSNSVGVLTRVRGKWLSHAAIRLFIRVFGVDLGEAEITQISQFETFNAFFTRALRAGTRLPPPSASSVACPADGRISEQGLIDGQTLLQAKGVGYTLLDLFDGDGELATRFDQGCFQTIYLAPHNYHRVHMPLNGRARYLRYIPGSLFSVNAATTRALPNLFCRNERVAVVFEHDAGDFAMIMVGAMNVGSIELTLPDDASFRNRPQPSLQPGRTYTLNEQCLNRGDEFGRFNMGSTVIFLASAGLVTFNADCLPGDRVRVGQDVGHCTQSDVEGVRDGQ